MKAGIYYDYKNSPDNYKHLKLISDTGFTHTGLWIGGKINSAKSRLPSEAQKAGLIIENIHANINGASALWDDNIPWEVTLLGYISYMELCHNNSVPTIIMHLTADSHYPLPNQLGVDRMKQLVELAEQINIHIALENTEKTEYLDYLFAQIDSPNLGFCYDSGHENCWNKSGNLLEKYGSRLMALHLHDNDGTGDQHKLPGDGNIDWIAVANQLKQCQYAGPITLEVVKEFSDQYDNLTEPEFLRLAYRRARVLDPKEA